MGFEPKFDWVRARRLREEEGYTHKQIAEEIGAALKTVENRSSREGWLTPEEIAKLPSTEKTVGEMTAQIMESAPSWLDSDERQAMERRLSELEAQLADAARDLEEKTREVTRLKPTADVSEFLTAGTVEIREMFGEQALRDMAAAELREVNRRRLRQGDERITWTDEEWEYQIEQAVAEIQADRRRHTRSGSARPARTLKMVAPSRQCGCQGRDPKTGGLRACYIVKPGHARLVQIPYEGQINNLNGSISDAVEVYRRKGFKVAEPMVCPTMDCWEAGVIDGQGRPTYGGYCSEFDRNRTEPRLGGARAPDAEMADVVSAGAYS